MYNWSVDIKKLKKDPEKYHLWKLEQMINFGLGGEKIKKDLLKKYWNDIDVYRDKKRYLKFLLWGGKSLAKRKRSF